jgi:hypothetical protein
MSPNFSHLWFSPRAEHASPGSYVRLWHSLALMHGISHRLCAMIQLFVPLWPYLVIFHLISLSGCGRCLTGSTAINCLACLPWGTKQASSILFRAAIFSQLRIELVRTSDQLSGPRRSKCESQNWISVRRGPLWSTISNCPAHLCWGAMQASQITSCPTGLAVLGYSK